MNRKDTIFIAVLINMGLLIILFVTAIRPTVPDKLSQENIPLVSHIEPTVTQKDPLDTLDPIDTVLSRYVEQEPIKKEVFVKEETPATPPPIETTEKSREIIVKSGDVLEKIAKRYHTTVSEIMRLNHLKDAKLQIGQILLIPDKDAGLFPEQEAKYYVVKNGDNPWTIAIKNGINVEELLRLNSLDDSKAKKLKPGDKLRIR